MPQNIELMRMNAAIRLCSVPEEFLRDEGFPPDYARAFQAVANSQKTVISTRTPGKACTGLLGEGYDAKSYHIKAKSCDWGPMSGFVCLDPLLNKNGIKGAAGNLEANHKSLSKAYESGRRADATPMIVSHERYLWLLKQHRLGAAHTVSDGLISGTVATGGVSIDYLLHQQSISSGMGWAIYYDRAKLYGSPAAQALGSYNHFNSQSPGITHNRRNYEPLMAMVNPHRPYLEASSFYKNGITGDYDLFAVWPRGGAGYEDELDERMVGMSSALATKSGLDQFIEYEHEQLGNISERIFLIAQLLNSEIAMFIPGTSKPNRAFHSDEGGRPVVDGAELPVAAFVPGHRAPILLKTTPQLRYFAMYCDRRGYIVFANGGWRKNLQGVNVRDSGQIANRVPKNLDKYRA